MISAPSGMFGEGSGDSDHSWNSQLAGNHRCMAEEASTFGDHSSGHREYRVEGRHRESSHDDVGPGLLVRTPHPHQQPREQCPDTTPFRRRFRRASRSDRPSRAASSPRELRASSPAFDPAGCRCQVVLPPDQARAERSAHPTQIVHGRAYQARRPTDTRCLRAIRPSSPIVASKTCSSSSSAPILTSRRRRFENHMPGDSGGPFNGEWPVLVAQPIERASLANEVRELGSV